MFTADYFKPVMAQAISVRLAARSFIIPIPRGIGALMTYPDDVFDSGEGVGKLLHRKGDPILNIHGDVKGVGLVFKNFTDNAVQCARGDGTKIIIINGISAAQGKALMKAYGEIIGPDSQKATAQQIHKLLDYAHTKLGIDDFFNGNQGKAKDYEPVRLHGASRDCGVFLRRSDEERFAVIGCGEGTYMGPAASPQRFKDHVVAVGNAEHIWLVQSSAFLNTYRHADDREISLSELPAFKMQCGTLPQAMSLKLG